MATFARYTQGTGLLPRIVRSASWVVLGHGAAQALRLASNLILTRILFPEAFGLMALVTMVIIGLALFSDLGLNQAVAQSKRGDDTAFLNTAWTLQVIRGGVLFALACVVAGPIAGFYEEPQLALYLPIAAASLLISGFAPTRIATAHRHLQLGRLTGLDLISQLLGLLVMVPVAWITQSALSLVVGNLVQALTHVLLCRAFLPGHTDRFEIERPALWDLINYGKWIFLSTGFFFFASQGDKAVLGKFLSLSSLGIYNIGFFLASFPPAIGIQVAHRLLISIYRERPPHESVDNFRKLAKLRHLASFGLITTMFVIGLTGPWIVDLLYDDRYALAGGVIVAIMVFKMILAVGLTYDQAALAAGDSRQYFVFSASRAMLQVVCLYIGVLRYGLLGGICGLAVAALAAHPILVMVTRKHGAWDPLHDAVWLSVVSVCSAGIIWVNWDAVMALTTM